jgi:hypothetical protein
MNTYLITQASDKYWSKSKPAEHFELMRLIHRTIRVEGGVVGGADKEGNERVDG